MAGKTSPIQKTIRSEGGRELMPLTEIRELVNEANFGLEALCELLWEANAAKIYATSVLELLKPLHKKISDASGDLTDMRL